MISIIVGSPSSVPRERLASFLGSPNGTDDFHKHPPFSFLRLAWQTISRGAYSDDLINVREQEFKRRIFAGLMLLGGGRRKREWVGGLILVALLPCTLAASSIAQIQAQQLASSQPVLNDRAEGSSTNATSESPAPSPIGEEPPDCELPHFSHFLSNPSSSHAVTKSVLRALKISWQNQRL